MLWPGAVSGPFQCFQISPGSVAPGPGLDWSKPSRGDSRPRVRREAAWLRDARTLQTERDPGCGAWAGDGVRGRILRESSECLAIARLDVSRSHVSGDSILKSAFLGTSPQQFARQFLAIGCERPQAPSGAMILAIGNRRSFARGAPTRIGSGNVEERTMCSIRKLHSRSSDTKRLGENPLAKEKRHRLHPKVAAKLFATATQSLEDRLSGHDREL